MAKGRSSSTAGRIHKTSGCVREYTVQVPVRLSRFVTCVGSAARDGVLRIPDVYIFIGEKIFYHNNTHGDTACRAVGPSFSSLSLEGTGANERARDRVPT